MNDSNIFRVLDDLNLKRLKTLILSSTMKLTLHKADIINEIIDSFPNLKFGLHICGGNAHRKRGYFGRYTEMLEGLKKLKVHEIHLEHCTLHYNMLDVFNDLKFDGIFRALDDIILNSRIEDNVFKEKQLKRKP